MSDTAESKDQEREQVDFASAALPGAAFHSLTARYRGQSPVVPVTFLGQPAFYFTSYQAVEAAFRDGESFPAHTWYQLASEPVMGRTFIAMPPREHRIYRKLATPAFRSRAVAGHDDAHYRRILHELIDVFAAQREADLVAQLTRSFPLIMISRMLGLPMTREDDFKRWALSLLNFIHDAEEGLGAAAEIGAFLKPLIEERRRNPREDVLSELVMAEVEGSRLSDEEIISHVRLLFPTGADTTYLALGNLIYALLTQEDAWDRVKSEPALRNGAIEELLRWEPPAGIIARLSCDCDIEFFGHTIPASSVVLFGVDAANRDPAVFSDPDRFDIQRKTEKLMTFGPGPRACPGMHLARQELRVALDVLVERLPDLRLLDLDAAQPRGTMLRGPTALQVAF